MAGDVYQAASVRNFGLRGAWRAANAANATAHAADVTPTAATHAAAHAAANATANATANAPDGSRNGTTARATYAAIANATCRTAAASPVWAAVLRSILACRPSWLVQMVALPDF